MFGESESMTPRAILLLVLATLVAGAPSFAAQAPEPGALRAAVLDLSDTFGPRYANGKAYLERLDALEAQLKSPDARERERAGQSLQALQREALLANPLVSGQPIAFIVRKQYRRDHHNTETMFQTGEINTASFEGGGAFKTIDFGHSGGPEIKTLWQSATGVARDPDVHFDGKKIVLSIRNDPRDDYHIYEMNADGSGLRQLTRAPGVFDIDPLYLADDCIAFTSSREPKYCMCNRHIMGNLFRMEPDGANIRQIGKNTLFEGHGRLMPDGRIMYDRWEYVDRNFGDAQGLWAVNPDGTSHTLMWKNNTGSPGAVLEGRIIPGTERILCTFSSCHDRPWGALAIVDPSRGLDGRAPVVRTWPAEAVALVDEKGSFDSFSRIKLKYEDPYPLSEKYFLCSRMTGAAGEGERMGLYLLDVFGNEMLLHVEGPGCFDPRPVAARTRPPVLNTRRDFENRDGYFYVMDVYQGTHMQGVKPGAVKSLRVVASPEKRYWSRPAWNGQGQEAPAMNWHDFSNKRILGTVPVEADGSAFFALPSDTFVYFQLLDEKGMMIQSMRSGTMVQSGEWTGCVGCHDRRHEAPQLSRGATPQALLRAPSKLEGWHGPARDFNYLTDVQPVFDRACVSCHDYGKKDGAIVNLARDRELVFNASYIDLWRKGLIKVVGAGPAATQPAYAWGSHASPLVQTLLKGHEKIALSPEDFDRIVTWIDINAPYYPSYATVYPENLAGRAPLDAKQLKRLSALTGIAFDAQAAHNRKLGPMVSFDRPERSPCLAKWQNTNDSDYREALALIRAGAQQLQRQPNPDSGAFAECDADRKRGEKYQLRKTIELSNRSAIKDGRKIYDNAAQ